MKYILRLFRRQSRLKPSRWRYLTRSLTKIFFIFTCLSFLILFIYSFLILGLNISETNVSNTIISLTSTPVRFHSELPLTLHSLLSQIELPKQIRIYLSPTSTIIKQKNVTLLHLKQSLQRLDSSEILSKLFDRLVKIYFEKEDYGPATKFLPILREFTSKSQSIMICDDDQYYHPYTLSTLNQYTKQYPNSILGFRGWRVRQDLIWGVGGKYEMSYHIVESHYLSKIYRVGVLTANYAYLINSLFFDPHIYLDFNQVSDDIRHVDDIWLNGHASKENIPRYVIPSCCTHISLTRRHILEEYLIRNHMNRLSANNHALEWFKDSWEKDLWYRFNGVNRPNYRNLFVMFYREWFFAMLKLKFIIYFGLI